MVDEVWDILGGGGVAVLPSLPSTPIPVLRGYILRGKFGYTPTTTAVGVGVGFGTQLVIRAYNPRRPTHSQAVVVGVQPFAAFLESGFGQRQENSHAAVLE